MKKCDINYFSSTAQLQGRRGLVLNWYVLDNLDILSLPYRYMLLWKEIPMCQLALHSCSNKVVQSSSKYMKLSKQQDCRTLSFLRENLWAQNLSSSERLEPGWCWCYLLTHTTSLKAGCCFSQTISSSSFMRRSKKFKIVRVKRKWYNDVLLLASLPLNPQDR